MRDDIQGEWIGPARGRTHLERLQIEFFSGPSFPYGAITYWVSFGLVKVSCSGIRSPTWNVLSPVAVRTSRVA
jgi:hypothetical protein